MMHAMTRQLGRRLKQQRRARRLSKYAVAKRAGISATYVAKLERGGSDPTIGVLRRLAKALDVPVLVLLA
jgi:XRE family transcriptional regulator, aerobic/anaerobic benzoate catabolism transcriptional regulator